MPAICSICRLTSAAAIDEQLRSGRSVRALALELGVSRDALGRHARSHLAWRTGKPSVAIDGFAGQKATNGSAHAHGPVSQPATPPPLHELADALRVPALQGHVLSAREYRLTLEGLAKSENAQAPQVDLTATSEWRRLRTAVLDALGPFPEARQAVADAIGRMGE